MKSSAFHYIRLCSGGRRNLQVHAAPTPSREPLVLRPQACGWQAVATFRGSNSHGHWQHWSALVCQPPPQRPHAMTSALPTDLSTTHAQSRGRFHWWRSLCFFFLLSPCCGYSFQARSFSTWRLVLSSVDIIYLFSLSFICLFSKIAVSVLPDVFFPFVPIWSHLPFAFHKYFPLGYDPKLIKY